MAWVLQVVEPVCGCPQVRLAGRHPFGVGATLVDVDVVTFLGSVFAVCAFAGIMMRMVVNALGTRIDDVNRRFDDVNHRFDQVDRRFEQIDHRFAQIDRRFEQIDQRFEQIDQRFGQIDQRFAQIDRRLERLESQHEVILAGLNDHGRRLAVLEDR